MIDINTAQQLYDGCLLPDMLVSTLRHADRLFPTRTVSRGDRVLALPDREPLLANLSFTSNGKAFDLVDYIALNRVSGLLIVSDGRIAFETYQLGNREDTRWASMSIAKSVTATLIGAAIHDGHIASLDDPVTQYVRQLAGSAYEAVTIRQLLQMTSGVAWDETYTDPRSDRRRMLDIQHAQRAGGVLELMASLPRAAEPGTRWNYSTGETQVAGAVLHGAVRTPLAEYLSDRIWSKVGMAADATWWLESPDGLEVGGSGIAATLRDYGRFGLFLLADGVAGGERILPEGWVREAGTSKIVNGQRVDYGYMFWPTPKAAGTRLEGSFEARGIFGQHIHVNPRDNIVIAVCGALPKPKGMAMVDNPAFYAAVADALAAGAS